MPQYQFPRSRPRHRRGARIVLLVVLVLILIGARTIAGTVIDYQWWKEIGQVDTWLAMYLYGVGPLTVATLLAFVVLWIAHARGMKFAGTGLHEHPFYARKLHAAGVRD